MSGLAKAEIRLVVYDFIGVNGGYLGDFSYRTHRDFYPDYCGLDIDPDEFDGTTRARFEHILKTSPPAVQAKILRGVLAKYPPNADDDPRVDMAAKIEALAKRLDGEVAAVPTPSPVCDAAAVRLALSDADALEHAGRPVSALDRIHTALHGYLKYLCSRASILVDDDPTITVLFKALRNQHPALIAPVPYAEERKKLLSSMSAGLDALGAIRNHGSLAHPNESLVEPDEARLAINYVKAVLHYLEARLAPQP